MSQSTIEDDPIELKEIEIIVFENQSIYEQIIVISNPIEKFIEMYNKYLSDIPKNTIEISFGKTFISCSDRSGGDKPIMIIIIGITTEIIQEILKEM